MPLRVGRQECAVVSVWLGEPQGTDAIVFLVVWSDAHGRTGIDVASHLETGFEFEMDLPFDIRTGAVLAPNSEQPLQCMRPAQLWLYIEDSSLIPPSRNTC